MNNLLARPPLLTFEGFACSQPGTLVCKTRLSSSDGYHLRRDFFIIIFITFFDAIQPSRPADQGTYQLTEISLIFSISYVEEISNTTLTSLT